jgi:hypothetical protein
MAPESQLTRSRIENAGRLINACDPEFRPLARAGLETRLPPEFTHQK